MEGKAYLEILQPPASAGGKPGGVIKRLELTFNPKELTEKRAAKYEQRSSKKGQPPEYKGLEPATMSVEVFLDKEICGGVPAAVDALFACLAPVTKTRDTNPAPPYITFGWGPRTYVTGVMKSVSVKYTLFDTQGEPIRAVCTVELQEAQAAQPKQNPTSGGLVPRNARTVGQGDTLMSIAYDEYGDPRLWRAVADANRVDDPLRLRPGTRLLLPSPADAAVSV